MLQGVASIMETFNKQSGSCLIVWPRRKLIGWQWHAAHLFFFFFFLHRLRSVEKNITVPHYPAITSPGKRGEGGCVGGRGVRNQNQIILFHITKVWARQYSRLMRWDRAYTNDCQQLPNLFWLQTGTICDCMLVIISYHLHLFGYLLHVPH